MEGDGSDPAGNGEDSAYQERCRNRYGQPYCPLVGVQSSCARFAAKESFTKGVVEHLDFPS
jgi:hypothetical protein